MSACRLIAAVGIIVAGAGAFCPSAGAAEPPADKPAAPSFERDVAPLLARRCLGCHNPQDHKGGLDLTSETSARAGGESGAVLVPGNVDQSDLWARVDADEMPPKKPLPAEEKAILRSWITAGAAWALVPSIASAIPATPAPVTTGGRSVP